MVDVVAESRFEYVPTMATAADATNVENIDIYRVLLFGCVTLFFTVTKLRMPANPATTPIIVNE